MKILCGIKQASKVIVVLLGVLIFSIAVIRYVIWRDNMSSFVNLVDESVVIIRCGNVKTNGFLVHRIEEIWRDESKGLFQKKIGDIIDTGFPVDDIYDYGEESLLFYGMLNKDIFNHKMLPIHDGVLPIHEALGIIRESKFSGKELIIEKKPQ